MENITLARIIDTICDIARKERNVHTIVLNDIYKLDALPDAKYSVFGLTQNVHTEDDQFIYYKFFLYYINRVTNDDASNEILNQSTGIQVLRNIIRKTVEYFDIEVPEEIRYNTFEQKFVDVTSGVYAEVTFAVPVELCDEYYGLDEE